MNSLKIKLHLINTYFLVGHLVISEIISIIVYSLEYLEMHIVFVKYSTIIFRSSKFDNFDKYITK